MIRKRRIRSKDGDELSLPGLTLSDDAEITPGLVPLGIPNVYQSPLEPVDPWDCERWPNSPYCGGNPLVRDRLAVSNEVAINPCEICVTITPTLGFVELAPYTICVRKNSPECSAPATDPDWGKIPNPEDFPQSIPANLYNNRCKDGSTFVLGVFLDKTGGNNPVFTDINEYFRWYHSGENLYGHIGRGGSIHGFQKLYEREIVKEGATIYDINHPEYGSFVDATMWEDETEEWGIQYRNEYYWIKYKDRFYSPRMRISFRTRGFYIGVPPAMESCYITQPYNIQILELPCETTTPPVYPPAYPLERPEACCMACSGESEELLRLIAKRLGTSDYPIPVPQSLLADRGSGQKTIESLSQFLHWFILQVDSVTGQFPVELEIKDNDPTKEGDQREKITIPNLAEGIAEILGASVNANINTQTLINAGIRTLVEAGSAKIHALETRYISQAIADYLAFDATEVKTPVGMTFTAGKTQLDEILQESEQKLPLYTYSDDRDFKAEMTELLFAAAVIRAVHYRKVTGDPKEDLKQRFKDLIKFAESEISPPSSGDDDQPKPKTDFDNFLEQVETGFINTPGIDDATNPYGRPYSERPRIRELGNTADNTDVSI